MNEILKNFIVIEGLDGAGTTTQLKKISKELENNNYKVYSTFEPTDRPIGRLVRDVLSKKFITTPLTLAKLYATDREDHLYNEEDGIIKQLNDEKIVISDRYFYSSLAYQGYTCDFDCVKDLNNYPNPQILIYIDTPLEECLNRINKRNNEKDIFENKKFLENVANNYERVISSLPKDVILLRIDGTKSVDEIASIITKKLLEIL
ncbi:MAG: dTMP kinase [Pleomorphochaeta sp.]